jgi:hypothetical protein
MSTLDFQKVLVRDDLINIEPSIAYAVKQGALQFTSQQFDAISKSTSMLTFNIQVPSELTVVDRAIKLRSSWTVRLRTPLAEPIAGYGIDTALAPFPVSGLFSTITANINNTAVSCQLQDLLYNVYLQSINKRDIASYNSTAPYYPDNYFSYADAEGAVNNPLSGYNNAVDSEIAPRGSFYIDNLVESADATYNYYDITFTTTEPLFLSPFIFNSEASNKAGLIGLTNLNIQMNIAGSNVRAVRTAIAGSQCTLTACNSATLLFNFATCPSTQILPSHQTLPYAQFSRYITTVPTITAGSLTAPSTARLVSSTITLNTIPDKLVICVRKSLSAKTSSDTDSFLPISGISLNFANQAGILSGATKEQLYTFSREAGSCQVWNEYCGRAFAGDPAVIAGKGLKTVGSVLMLDFGKHINLSEPYYSAGVLGQFVLSFILNVENYSTSALADYEICLVTMESGIMVNQKGSSVTYVGVLSKDMVVQATAPDAPVYVGQRYARMVGGGFWDKLLSVGKSVLPAVLPVASQLLSSSSHPLAQTAGKVLGAVSGGAEAMMPKRKGRHPKLM